MSVAVIAPVRAIVPAGPVRVMVVDDSVIVRGLVQRWIDAEPDLSVVAVARDGREALESLDAADPAVVVLDIEMPELDGLATLPLLLAKRPNLAVIVASTLTRHNAEGGFRALSLGAADCIGKPEARDGATGAASFHRQLIAKIRQFGGKPGVVGKPIVSPPPPRLGAAARELGSAPFSRLRVAGTKPPRVLLLGASTGGPQALMTILGRLGPVVDRVPVLVVQHMPSTFTAVLAQHAARASGRPAREAADGEAVTPGAILVAPGGRHMRVVRQAGRPVIAIGDDAPIHFSKPAVDPLFESAAEIWGAATLAVILTGMGSDGSAGAGAVVAAGGTVMAQDEASSVVWGMPGAVANAGLCSAVLPLEQIAPRLMRLFSGERP